MATIKNKQIYLYCKNPNGTHDTCNDLTQFSIFYWERAKTYQLSLMPCTKQDWGGISMNIDFVNRSVDLAKVSRRNAKVQRTCEDWMQRNVEALNSAYLANGMNGVKEVVRDLWNFGV